MRPGSSRVSGSSDSFIEDRTRPLLKACVAIRACADAREWAEAINIFEQLRSDGVQPNVIIYGALINALGKAGRHQQCLDLYREMPSYHVVPNTIVVNSVLQSCCVAKKWMQAVELFQEMIAEGLYPDQVTYGTMINIMGKAYLWKEALAFFEDMKLHFQPTDVALTSCVAACTKSQNWEVAMQLFDDHLAFRSKSKLSTVTYNAILNVLASCGQWRRAMDIWNRMPEHGVQRMTVTFNTMLQAFHKVQKTSKVQDTCEFFDHAAGFGVTPNVISYNILFKVLLSYRKTNLALRYFVQMIERKITPQPTHTYVLVRHLDTSPKYQKLIEEMKGAPNAADFLERLRSFL